VLLPDWVPVPVEGFPVPVEGFPVEVSVDVPVEVDVPVSVAVPVGAKPQLINCDERGCVGQNGVEILEKVYVEQSTR